MKKLLVLANEFPYGHTEPYMETEEKYYNRFEKVWICALQLRNTTAVSRRNLVCGATVIPVWYKSRLFYLLNSITALFDKSLYSELKELWKSKRLTISRIIDLFVFLSRAHHEASVIDNTIKDEDKNDFIIYSYRFEYQPYVAILLKKKWNKTQNIVCRAHRYDLYEEQHNNDYIPLRKLLLDNVDYVFPCSEHGTNYVNGKYGKRKAIVQTRYLGTIDHGERKYSGHFTDKSKTLSIVSCSNVAKVKRIEKIINALSMIKDIDLEWTHYGDGDFFQEIKQLAGKKLGNNVHAHFAGNIANNELLNEYSSKDFDVFINVSASEGLPVSIMEVMSFGIPCIATDVGGTREIVNQDNGVLIPMDIEDKEIAEKLRKFFLMSKESYQRKRENARQYWDQKFNAAKNYQSYMDELISLCSHHID